MLIRHFFRSVLVSCRSFSINIHYSTSDFTGPPAMEPIAAANRNRPVPDRGSRPRFRSFRSHQAMASMATHGYPVIRQEIHPVPVRFLQDGRHVPLNATGESPWISLSQSSMDDDGFMLNPHELVLTSG